MIVFAHENVMMRFEHYVSSLCIVLVKMDIGIYYELTLFHRWWQLGNVDWTMIGFTFVQLKCKESALII